MPIYEYETLEPGETCEKCVSRFEIIQGINEEPLSSCTHCGKGVRKVISMCRAMIGGIPDEYIKVKNRISEYEKEGRWSHAAELADTQSEKLGDRDMKNKALDDYKRAGYDVGTLEKYSNKSSD